MYVNTIKFVIWGFLIFYDLQKLLHIAQSLQATICYLGFKDS